DGTLYIGVAVKRKLQLFKWTDREFEEIALDLAFPDVIQAVSWCDERVAVAVRDEYFMVTVFERSHSQSHNTDTVGTIRALFTMGNRPIEPLIVSMPDRRMIGFCRDDSTIFVDFDGKSLSREYIDIRWSEVPIAVAYDPPYLVALLPKNIEIRSIKPSVCVQVVQLPKVRMLAGGISGHVYAAAAHDLWEMTTAPNLKQNIQQLVKEKQYEMAIQLAERLEEEDVERSRSIQEIKHLYAFNLFCQRKFTEAFAMFSEIGSEVLYVIGLFPDLLPDEIRNNIVYPDALPPRMNTEELRNGLQGLAGFLSETRTRIAYLIAMQPRLRDKKELSAAETTQLLSGEQLQQNRNLLQIVDTTLLRCYVETNDMLVASLLRLPDNSCNVPATEKILRERQKFYELFLLYERKGMHSEALDLLKSQSKNEKSSLKGLERTVHYLQNLGNSRLDLIFKYSSWVLQESDLEGLKIFTEDCDEVRGLDRERVLHYLLSECPSAVIPYLEHIILQWNDARPKLHNTLAELYLEKVKALLRDYLQSLPAGHQVLPAGKEPGQLSEYRSKLIFFLGMSFHYSPELLLVQIPHDALFEERALLLGRMKRHEQAIAIYTNILHDYKAAENYCNTYYDKTN
uniref:CNH domain-containing protein n=1 Tax=Plectus sambesii TaxID=2011161 RepID=A0A914X4H1_9BILA